MNVTTYFNPPHLSIGRDVNGNKVLRIKPTGARGFSIQTNGNMPATDRHGIGTHTWGELRKYVSAFGTERERAICGL